jgi:hypothetical protein
MKLNVLKASRSFLLAILCGWACMACAAEQGDCPAAPEPLQLSPDQVRVALRQAQDQGFLWRIRKDNHTSYLYGTLHLGRKDTMFPGPHLQRALATSDTLALELDILDPDIQSRLTASMAAAKGAQLPEALARRMAALAASLCTPYEPMAQAMPEIQIAMLAALLGRRDGLETAYAIDIVLALMGHGNKKAVVSLETPESQIQAIQMGDAQQTAAYVSESLDELQSERGYRYLMRLTQAWAQADYKQMASFYDWCECMDTEIERTFMKRLLDDRNPAMAQKVDAMHSSGKRVLAAVGSLHMVGPTGLPALMQKLGYEVEQVNFTEH